MLRHGWTLLFHEGVTLQLRKLQEAAARAEQNDPQGFEGNANVKLFRALSHLIMEAVPADPGRDEFRQGSTLACGDMVDTFRQAICRVTPKRCRTVCLYQ